jgi:hypothetical protein
LRLICAPINDLAASICLEADLPDYLTPYHHELRNALLYVSVHSRYLFFGATWRTAANQPLRMATGHVRLSLAMGAQGLEPSLRRRKKMLTLSARSRKACLNEWRENHHCVNVMAPKKNETKSSR